MGQHRPQFIMNLKQQISKFRSEIVIGKYQSAIALGKQTIAHLDLLAQIHPFQTQTLRDTLQEQYQKCLALNALLKYHQIHKEEEPVKKWNNKPSAPTTSKWKKKEQPEPTFVPSPPTTSQTQSSPIKLLVNEQLASFLQKLQSEIMMPLKMPTFFKGKPQIPQIIATSQEHHQNVLNYFQENDFFKTDLPFLTAQLKDTPDNFFAQNNLKELLVDSHEDQLHEILSLRNDPLLAKYHCIFVVQSSKYELELL